LTIKIAEGLGTAGLEKVAQAATTLTQPEKSAAMSLTLFRAIGLLGAAVFVVAYLANQARWLRSEDWRFPAANLAGALLILISLFGEWNLPSVVIEAFWAAISVYGLCNGRWLLGVARNEPSTLRAPRFTEAKPPTADSRSDT
jgi:hypothetical protein